MHTIKHLQVTVFKQVCSVPSLTSKMEGFAKLVNGLQLSMFYAIAAS